MKGIHMGGYKTARLITVSLGVAILASACTSEPNRPTVRSSTETAPTDLQLLCAAEGATRFGVARDKALPVSSARESSNSYRVNLNLGGTPAICIINDTGIIESLSPG